MFIIHHRACMRSRRLRKQFRKLISLQVIRSYEFRSTISGQCRSRASCTQQGLNARRYAQSTIPGAIPIRPRPENCALAVCDGQAYEQICEIGATRLAMRYSSEGPKQEVNHANCQLRPSSEPDLETKRAVAEALPEPLTRMRIKNAQNSLHVVIAIVCVSVCACV